MYAYLYNESSPTQNLTIAVSSLAILADGLEAVARVFAPYVLMTIGVLIVFSVLCSLVLRGKCVGEWESETWPSDPSDFVTP